MKIKRFFAPDIRQAIKLVRDELGSDAVILSNRQIEGGIEIISAVDYDEKLLEQFSSADKSSNQPAATPLKVRADPAATKQAAVAPDITVAPPITGGVTSKPSKGTIVWSQEPTLAEMRKEMKTLRGLLETQLSGLAWSDLKRRFPLQAELLQRLTKLGLGAKLCERIVMSITADSDIDALWTQSLAHLQSLIPTADHGVLDEGGIIALVGPTGVGKTTTVAKLAARYALRHGSRHVGLITIDNYRIGAQEQLRAYARILDVPMRTANSDSEIERNLEDLWDRRLVIIDTAGMSQRDVRLPKQLAQLKGNRDFLKTFLVLSSNTRMATIEETIEAYQPAQLQGCILTKLDETTCLGAALNSLIEHSLPIAFLSDGQRVPEDLHAARADKIVERAAEIMRASDERLEEELFTYKAGGAIADARV